jgi:hypothetical protein
MKYFYLILGIHKIRRRLITYIKKRISYFKKNLTFRNDFQRSKILILILIFIKFNFKNYFFIVEKIS